MQTTEQGPTTIERERGFQRAALLHAGTNSTTVPLLGLAQVASDPRGISIVIKGPHALSPAVRSIRSFFDAACTRNHSNVPLHLPLDLLELFRWCLCLEVLHPWVVLVRNAPLLAHSIPCLTTCAFSIFSAWTDPFHTIAMPKFQTP